MYVAICLSDVGTRRAMDLQCLYQAFESMHHIRQKPPMIAKPVIEALKRITYILKRQEVKRKTDSDH